MPQTAPKPFLTAQWKHLAMLNFEVDPAVLAPFVPAGTELDFYNGRTYLSVVGFMFLQTRVRGCRIPGHVNFPEVNLRLYVRRESNGELRRGVAFVKEIVNRRAVSLVARRIYHEKYVTHPMNSAFHDGGTNAETRASYRWWSGRRCNEVMAGGLGLPSPVKKDSEEHFITEHFWGYSSQPDGNTVEYEVQHPSWNIWPDSFGHLDCDVSGVYGEEFAESLSKPPSSAFLVEGSDIIVYQGRRILA